MAVVSMCYKLKNGCAWDGQKGLDVQGAAAELDKLALGNGHEFDVETAVKLANDPSNPLYTAVTHNAKDALYRYQKVQLRGLARSLVREVTLDDGTVQETRMFTAIVVADADGNPRIQETNSADDDDDGDSYEPAFRALQSHVYVSDIGINRDANKRILALKEYAARIKWLQDGASTVEELKDANLHKELDAALRRIRASIRAAQAAATP